MSRIRTILSCTFVAMTLAGLQAVIAAPADTHWRPYEPRAKEPLPAGQIRWEKKQLSDNLNEGIAVFDVNKDGVLDITAGPNWYEGPTFKPHPLREVKDGLNEEYMDSNGEHAMDVDGDGWTDLLTASWFNDRIYWHRNPGKAGLATGERWSPQLITNGQNCCEGTVLEDLDGDGVPELAINSWDHDKPMVVIRITPGKEGQAPKFDVVDLGSPGTGHGIAVGDINGDGRKDIVVPQGWFEQPAAKWSTTKWPFHKAGYGLEHSSLPGLIVDLNGDGRNDIITGHGHDYGVRWLEQGPPKDGEPTWIDHEIDKSFSQVHVLVWADIDGDGANEVITGKRWRGHKDGDPGSAEPIGLYRYLWKPAEKKFVRDVISYDDGVGTGMQIRVADLDGDKRPDIAVAGKTGTYVLFNRGLAGK